MKDPWIYKTLIYDRGGMEKSLGKGVIIQQLKVKNVGQLHRKA